jgi:hypothetical protein
VSCCRIIPEALIALCLLPALIQTSNATDYFVDMIGGSDALPGTQADAGNGNGPWRTLARLQNADLVPGDRVSLRCKGVWLEPLALRLKGTAAAPIVIGAYGECTGRRPEIRPAETVLPPESFEPSEYGWAAPLAHAPGMVYTQDAALPRARFPATHTLPLHWANGKLRVQLKKLPVSPDVLRGADWVVRTNDYTLEERRLYGVDPQGAVALAKPFAMRPADGAGYFLEGQPWMLPVSGGWAYDPQSAKLVLHDKPAQPVYVNNQQFAVALDRSAHVRLQGLAIRFVAGVGVEVADSSSIALDDLEVSDVGIAFLRAQRSDNLIVSGLHGQRSQRDGVMVQRSTSAQITDCLLEDIGVSANPRKSIAAIFVEDAPASLVARNRIYRTGYAAIMFGNNDRVEHNVIEDACLQLADCGAIYTSGVGKNYGHYNAVVANNLITGVPGNLEGSTSPYALTAGIYLDDESRGIMVRGNYVEKAQRGIFSKASSSQIMDNAIFDNAIGLMLTDSGACGSSEDASEVQDNTIVSRAGQAPYLVTARSSDAPPAGVERNLILMEGPVAAETWLAGHKIVMPMSPNARRISKMFSLVNTSAVPRLFDCPLPRSECSMLRKPDGGEVVWPLELEPLKAVLLVKEGGA